MNGWTPGRRVRRLLHSGDPRGSDYRAAEEWVKNIRSRLSHIRGELEELARIESATHDGICDDVAGSLTLALIGLHVLLEGRNSLAGRAEASDTLWDDAAADPGGYAIEDGTSWDWRPTGIYKRGGPPDHKQALALDLAGQLISYSGLRDKVRNRTDASEYEEAERLIAQYDALRGTVE